MGKRRRKKSFREITLLRGQFMYHTLQSPSLNLDKEKRQAGVGLVGVGELKDTYVK